MSDDYNMSMRKFLKQLGVTSQTAIEDALRRAEASGQPFEIKAVVTIDALDMTHQVTGSLTAQD